LSFTADRVQATREQPSAGEFVSASQELQSIPDVMGNILDVRGCSFSRHKAVFGGELSRQRLGSCSRRPSLGA
jgi:hypothetical protein